LPALNNLIDYFFLEDNLPCIFMSANKSDCLFFMDARDVDGIFELTNVKPFLLKSKRPSMSTLSSPSFVSSTSMPMFFLDIPEFGSFDYESFSLGGGVILIDF
jgi:hypothetical protein